MATTTSTASSNKSVSIVAVIGHATLIVVGVTAWHIHLAIASSVRVFR
jgi:hypothetical protein